MLPGDTYRQDKSTSSPIPSGLANALQRDVSVIAGSGNNPSAAWPVAPTWGGSRMMCAMEKAGVATATDWHVDTTMDWRWRFLIAWVVCYDAANKLPGGGAEPNPQPGDDSVGGDAPVAMPVWGYTSDGAGSVVFLTHGTMLGDKITLKVEAGSGHLLLGNSCGATVYPFVMIQMTDQICNPRT